MTLLTIALTTVTLGAVVVPLWQRAVSFVRVVTIRQTLARAVDRIAPPQRAVAFADSCGGPFGGPVLRQHASRWERWRYAARTFAWNALRRVVSIADWMRRQVRKAWLVIILPFSPLAHAQASPFSVGAAAVQNNFLVIFTPIAVVSVMAVAIAFWFNRLSAAWAIGWVIGIVLFFGAPQMVAWVRAMFGV